MRNISLLLVLAGFLGSASAVADHVRRAGNHECYSSSRGYYFDRHYKDCPGAHRVAKAVKPAPVKMCSCPCKK